MTDPYDFWRRALAGEKMPMHESDPQSGFYRKRIEASKGARGEKKFAGASPVAIWFEDGKPIATVGTKVADANEIWTYVCQNPVTEEAYRTVMAGGLWPDESEPAAPAPEVPAADAVEPAADAPGNPRAVPGNNEPPTAESMKDQIDAAYTKVTKFAVIKDDEELKAAQSARARLNELSGDADKTREALVRPHLDAQKKANTTWMPLVKKAADGALAIKKAMEAYATKKHNEQVEAERKRLAEVARLEKIAREEAEKNAPKGQPAPTPPPPEPAPAPVMAAAPLAIKGVAGRAATQKLKKIAVVKDQAAAYAYLAAQPELIELIQKLAQRAVDGGQTVPGVETTEEVKIS